MTVAVRDRFGPAQSVADAVLYEGYVLYPYRASSPKNRVRWQFGVLMPPAWSDHDPSERSTARTECLVRPGSAAAMTIRIRFLQHQERAVETPRRGRDPGPGGPRFVSVDRLEVDGTTHVPWDEALDCSVDLGPAALAGLMGRGTEVRHPFSFDAGMETEPIVTREGSTAGRLVRRRQRVTGQVRVRAVPADAEAGLVRVSVAVENTTATDAPVSGRDGALAHALLALHAMVAADDATFVSLLDPPDTAAPAAAACRSEGIYPVLVGDDLVLASPIILYDHPEVAPESPGDLYDATEIDEILALRVLTLTDEEKREARGTDARAAAVIDRCDSMAPEAWERLHGTFRPVPGAEGGPSPEEGAGEEVPPVPWWDPTADAAVDPFSDSVLVEGKAVAKGTPVRLRPSRRADAHDLFYRDQEATVAGVFRDVDGTVQVAVVLDDDPGRDELLWQGRYLFFHPDEIELRDAAGARPR